MPEKRKYGRRDESGNVTELNEKDYQKEYATLQDANRIAIDDNLLEGQQHRPSRNKGKGLFVEITNEEDAKPATATPKPEQKTENGKPNMMASFKPRETVWGK
ncbi:MAG: hypothetical protein JZU53_06945 [Paludibacter sp.]|nr:hypothetical protein [Paludibacter sp.]